MATRIRSVAELRALRKRLLELKNLGAAVAPRVAARFSSLARAQFDARRSPSGTPWKPNKGGKNIPTLHKSGALEGAAAAFRAIGSTVRVSVLGLRYAKFQNPQRFIPSMKKLDPERRAIVASLAEQEFRRALGGAA